MVVAREYSAGRGPQQSRFSRILGRLPESADAEGELSLHLVAQPAPALMAQQDVGLALSAAHTYDLPLPLGWAARSVYDEVCKENDGEWATKDFR